VSRARRADVLSRRALVAAAAACLVARPAAAHRSKSGVTQVLFNPRTGMIEIMHRLYAHDCEHALEAITGAAADIRRDAGARDAVARRAAKAFSLGYRSGGEASAAPLAFVGSEIDGAYLWIYQETPIPGRRTDLVVSSGLLFDLYDDQQNLVNVHIGDRVVSLVFEGSAAPQKVSLASDG